MTRVCRHDVAIYAPFADALYMDGSGRSAGGAETQTWELAHALSERGLRVCHIVHDHKDLPRSNAGNITLVRQPADAWTRSVFAYTRAIIRALEEADAEVYIQRTAGFDTGVVATYARARGRNCIFSSSSITDIRPRAPLPPKALVAFTLGRRLANEIVVQTYDQLDLASRVLHRKARLIRSFCRLPATSRLRRRAFLWIGANIEYKNPLAYLELAARIPEAQFWMIATDRGEPWKDLRRRVEAEAARLPNCELLPARSRSALGELYGQAVAVVNTSRFEGFPNTFLEGWATATPVLSLNVDPDGIIGGHGLGACAAGSLDVLTAQARQLWTDSVHARMVGAACRRYVATVHSPDRVGDEWEELVGGLLRR